MGDFDPATEQFSTHINRHGLKMFIKVIEPPEVRGNAYLVHGFRDVHDAGHMRALTAAYVTAGYRVVVWDATHSWGRSEGSSEQATFYHHYEDLEDVMEWSKGQPWYMERFVLAGHSLGGMMAGTYAAAHAENVVSLVLVAPVVSGPALRRRIPGVVRWWWRRRGEVRLPRSRAARASWEFMRSSWAYDLLKVANRLSMPVLIVAAGRDFIVPPRLMRRLFRAVPHGQKQLEIVPGALHGFDREWEMGRLTELVLAHEARL
jgi:pimeloyl-ACP methyl ester carboxylesterase